VVQELIENLCGIERKHRGWKVGGQMYNLPGI